MRVLILANFGMGLYKLRRELVEELIKRNHEVFVSVPNDDYVPRLEKLGCRYVRTELDRRGTNPIADLKLLLSYIKTIKRIKPDVVLTYTIKPNVYGGIACRFTNTPYVANVTGLGTSIETKGLTQKIALFLYRIGLKEACCVFFQNESNRQFFCQNRIVEVRTRTIPGSGVNLHDHPFEEYPSERDGIRFLFIGRIMRAKGIDDLLEAATRVVKEYPVVSFDLVGGSEEDYLNQ
jgi:glycosyltransferase involved in cell wall biosynthesis